MAKPKKEDTLHYIPLSQIMPSPNNTRKTLDQTSHLELVASIRSVGLLQPIVIRPRGKETPPYEIIFGERRYRAMSEIAAQDGTPETAVIRSIIRSMDDNEAFIARIVENLQREGVSEQEEASAFADFAEKYGENAIEVLSEKIGMTQTYVRKRIAIMQLSRPFLLAWKREVISYGHLEQFLRLQDKRTRLLYLAKAYARDKENVTYTIADLKHDINSLALPLNVALFDTAKCSSGCIHNSATQRSMFAIGDGDEKCQNQTCFSQKQTAWLTENWKTFDKNEAKTNSFLFQTVGRTQNIIYMYAETHEKCLECENYASLIYASGEVVNYGRRICKGEPGCLAAMTKRSPTRGLDSVGNRKAPDAPRVEWHGEFFRQEFYKTQIPAKIIGLSQDDSARMALFALVYANTEARNFVRTTFLIDLEPEDFHAVEDILAQLAKHDIDRIELFTREALQYLIFADRAFGDSDRRKIADYLKVDLVDWTFTADYLQKKTRLEILQLIADHQFMLDPAFLKALSKKHGLTKPEHLPTLKKKEMVDLILYSGADLAGKVPKEISSLSQLYDWRRPVLTTPASAEDPEEPQEDEEPEGQVFAGDDLEGETLPTDPDTQIWTADQPDAPQLQELPKNESGCRREQSGHGYWLCLNGITSCLHNDGKNACTEESDSASPLEAA
ncbi:MAG: ParB/RepB/Spo0J family partition protein [Syntrophobacteraceae bacterium]